MLENPASNKMMTDAPEEKSFHFSGDGIWHNRAILVETRAEAEKLWHATKQLINPEKPPIEIDTKTAVEEAIAAPEQSTPTAATEIEGGVVE